MRNFSVLVFRAILARPWAGLSLALVSYLGAGCTGNISQPSHEPGGSSDNGGSGGGNKPGTGPNGSGGAAAGVITVGNTPLRRLSNTEYARSLRDLTGESGNVLEKFDFPSDGRVFNFDNNAENINVSALGLRVYRDTAEWIATNVLADANRFKNVVGCDVSSPTCMGQFIKNFGRKAWRRPLSAEETKDLLSLAATEPAPRDGVARVLEGLLQSANFLFRPEFGVDAGTAHPSWLRLSGYEVATRLSYMLVATTPPDWLLDSAGTGDLDDANGVAKAARMLMDSTEGQFGLQRFLAQWLHLDQVVTNVNHDPALFPAWKPTTATSMVDETTRFLTDALQSDVPFEQGLLAGRHTFVNAELSTLYGVTPPAGNAWSRVELPTARIGLLTQGSVLNLTAKPTRTLAVLRGKYVRDLLMCGSPLVAPPGVPKLVDPLPGESEADQFARHTQNPVCASCHAYYDPIGFGLAGFDAIGRAQTKDANGAAISTSGYIDGLTEEELPDPAFVGPTGLVERLLASGVVQACLTKQLFRFAYGRGDLETDEVAIGNALADWRKSDGKGLDDLALALAGGEVFRYRTKDQ